MAAYTVSGAKLDGCALVLGEERHVIEREPEYFGHDPEQLNRLKTMIGMGERYTARPETTTADLCHRAASSLMGALGVAPEDIGTVVSVTQTPDYPMPGNAHVLHERLGLPTDAAALDAGMGCSGFVYGLWLASMATAAGATQPGMEGKKTLLVAGDTLSKKVSPEDRTTAPLFGDAGSAVLLSSRPDARMRFILRSDGSRLRDMYIPGACGPVLSFAAEQGGQDAGDVRSASTVVMDGFAVFRFAMTEQPRLLRDILAYSGQSVESIDYFILHQANRYIVETITKKAGIIPEKAPSDLFSRYGNQNSASIPGVLCGSLARALRERTAKAVLQGYGTGLSWGACQLELDRIICLEPEVYRSV